MDDKPHRDRYEVSPDNVEAQFLDAEQTVLVNKAGISRLEPLQVAEEEGLAKASEMLLSEVRTDTPLTCELLTYIHRRIFGDLYEWAGRWRTVQISKPGAVWPPPVYLDEAMQGFQRSVLYVHQARSLEDDEAFCKAVGEIQGEFLAIHPFREGNARAIKLLTDLLAAQTGRPLLLYVMSGEGREQYIEAAKAAMATKDYGPMVAIIRQALDEARKPS